MSPEHLKETMELTLDRDRQEFAFGDTLDIKTSILLAALIFLTGLSGSLLQGPLTLIGHCIQFFAIVVLILGGISAVLELWPWTYELEGPPNDWSDWTSQVSQLYKSYPDADARTLAAERSNRVKMAQDRIGKNLAANLRKAQYMEYSFYCTVLVFALNVVTVVFMRPS